MKRSLILATAMGVTTLLWVADAQAQLPDPGMEFDVANTALVITDPQNDFLSPDGVAWGVVEQSVLANNTVPNLETLLRTAKESGVQVFISPHYYYPTDNGWQFEGSVCYVELPAAAVDAPVGRPPRRRDRKTTDVVASPRKEAAGYLRRRIIR